jgi:hypothetical protein
MNKFYTLALIIFVILILEEQQLLNYPGHSRSHPRHLYHRTVTGIVLAGVGEDLRVQHRMICD